MNEPLSIAFIVVFKNTSVLLVQHTHSKHIEGIWGLPGGKIERGEEGIGAAQRELEEETGLRTERENLVPLTILPTANVTFKNGSVRTCAMHAFLCKHFDGEVRGTEREIPKWISLTKLDSLPLLPNVKQAIHEALQVVENRPD